MSRSQHSILQDKIFQSLMNISLCLMMSLWENPTDLRSTMSIILPINMINMLKIWKKIVSNVIFSSHEELAILGDNLPLNEHNPLLMLGT